MVPWLASQPGLSKGPLNLYFTQLVASLTSALQFHILCIWHILVCLFLQIAAHTSLHTRMANLQAIEQEQQHLQAKADSARSDFAEAKAAYVKALQAQLEILAE
eukprot:429835-Pelagomonas_calceolata.AAC.3